MYMAETCTSTELLLLLLENGARSDARNSDGKSAFDYAKENLNLLPDEIYWALNKEY